MQTLTLIFSMAVRLCRPPQAMRQVTKELADSADIVRGHGHTCRQLQQSLAQSFGMRQGGASRGMCSAVRRHLVAAWKKVTLREDVLSVQRRLNLVARQAGFVS